ncbi:sensor domain-containing protein [Ornithinibacillus halophilus]|uniref:PAS domain S-box-containing protein/diguanylate cyclase (GGDEF) domain-containing protein n=1 Tax=Ornithinibacillus halophilus TaxID=930117 RepID=A0A1M5INF6_9BACI|nr:EAL domain-containing protein [Ornithinibacillus halophilus]SHG29771.1 PAS domain S-box-containing protein/diguanylate cyclase (GGDEF) domain-containing protein [Ornithinibacillus halophilus]
MLEIENKQNALNNQLTTFNKALKAIENGLFIIKVKCNSTYSFVFANDSFLKYTGKENTSITNMELHKVLNHSDANRFISLCQQAFDSNCIQKENFSIENCKAEMILIPFSDDNIKYILGIVLCSTNDDSQTRNHILAKAYENMPQAMCVTNEKNKIIYINPSYTKLTGYLPEEVIGKNPNILSSGIQDRDFYQSMWRTLRQEGKWTGEMWNRKKNGELFLEEITIQIFTDEKGHIENHVAMFRDITEKKQLENKLHYQAHHDELTELPNRNYLYEYICTCLKDKSITSWAVMFLDLDRFKEINDTLGHSAGDALLKHVAIRLSNAVSDEVFISRYGGDEFVIIDSTVSNQLECKLSVYRILKAFEQPFEIEGYNLYITPSIGISMYPDHGDDADTLLKHADAAMYKAKHTKNEAFHFYRPVDSKESFEKLMLANDLRQAIKNNEFTLYYQPQSSLKTNKITGVEALIRWNHPQKGMISPGVFIPIAEETGLIQEIDQWVLYQACLQHKHWLDKGFPPIKIAVNLSMTQFQKKNLFEIVSKTLSKTGVSPKYIELELTESVIMENPELTLSNIKKLNSIGIQLSLDDFGTHYSSLLYLKKLPLNRLKIDKSFVLDLLNDSDDRVIIQAMINLAHNLNMTVIAEGVENQQQLSFLQKNHCDEIQGFYLSKPIPQEKFSAQCF